MSASPKPAAPDNPIDEPVAQIVRRKARSLVGCAGLTHQDRPDLEQELKLLLIPPLRESSPTVPGRLAYVQCLVDRFASNILRARRMPRRDGGPITSLGAPAGDDAADLAAAIGDAERDAVRGTSPRSDAELSRLALDVTAVLERLPDDLRAIAVGLMRESVTALARRLGVPRSTLRDRLRPIRERFARGNLDES